VEGIGEVVDVGVGVLESVRHALDHTLPRTENRHKGYVSMSLMRLLWLLGEAARSGLRLPPHLLPLKLR
jgi:hypothetical protein